MALPYLFYRVCTQASFFIEGCLQHAKIYKKVRVPGLAWPGRPLIQTNLSRAHGRGSNPLNNLTPNLLVYCAVGQHR